jgi:hypothetical protein
MPAFAASHAATIAASSVIALGAMAVYLVTVVVFGIGSDRAGVPATGPGRRRTARVPVLAHIVVVLLAFAGLLVVCGVDLDSWTGSPQLRLARTQAGYDLRMTRDAP